MKILHILSTDRLSGAENVHLDILRALKDENEVIYASPDGPIREAVESAGVRFIPFDPESPKNIKKLCEDEKPDIVHAADPRMSFKCALAGIPFISHLHNNCPWMKKYSPNSFALAFAAKRAVAVIAVSESVPDSFVFRRSFEDKLTVLPNAVDRERVLRSAQEPFDKEYDVLFVGRFTEQKRPLLFLSHVLKLTEAIPDLKAAMIGEGELSDDVLEFIEKHAIKNVDLLGFQSNPYKIMARSRINMMTSYYEGFGLVAVEGMILGIPPIAYPSGGITQIAEAGGVLCRSDTEMTDAAIKLLTDEKYYAEVSCRAKEASYKYTDSDAYINQIKQIYLNSARCR